MSNRTDACEAEISRTLRDFFSRMGQESSNIGELIEPTFLCFCRLSDRFAELTFRIDVSGVRVTRVHDDVADAWVDAVGQAVLPDGSTHATDFSGAATLIHDDRWRIADFTEDGERYGDVVHLSPWAAVAWVHSTSMCTS